MNAWDYCRRCGHQPADKSQPDFGDVGHLCARCAREVDAANPGLRARSLVMKP